jgi:hypothetical protein
LNGHASVQGARKRKGNEGFMRLRFSAFAHAIS